MARGKQTCKILKEIRRQIAEANGIEFATSECRYKGDCPGTCPRCETEVRYLEEQLRSRSLAGKAVVLAGISAGMVFMSGCSGSTAKNQYDDDLLGEFIESPEMVEAVEDAEEGELPIPEDSVSSQTERLIGIKEGEVPEKRETVVTQGELLAVPCADTDEGRIYSVVEKWPQFPGGQAAMMKFICDNFKYPEEMARGGVDFQGRVVVRFYVDTLGKVCDPKVIRGADTPLETEAMRIVGLFPDFIPGTINDRKVNTYMTVPININLNF